MGVSAYEDFDLAVARRRDVLEVRVLDSPAGETPVVRTTLSTVIATPTASATPTAADRHTNRDVGDGLAPARERADSRVGEALFAALLHGDVLVRYRDSVRRTAEDGVGLRLVLRFGGGADALPWELLWDPGYRRFLALDDRTPIVRCIEMPVRAAAPRIDGPLRVLLATSTPTGLSSLDAEHERVQILKRLETVSAGGALEVELLVDASLEAIQRAVDRTDVHVFHYIGHGSRLPDGRSALELTAADGSRSTRSADELAAVLGAASALRLVVLNSCHGAAGDGEDPFEGAAASLVKVGVPAVVAMRGRISDAGAIAFAGELYADLVFGRRIEQAVTRGRVALFAADDLAPTDWSTVALSLGSSLPADLTASALPRLDEDVQFTVSRPGQLRPGQWEPMLVFAHHGQPFRSPDGATIDQPGLVGERIAGFFGPAGAATTVDAAAPIPQGAGLIVVPDLPDVDCNPQQQPIRWTGDVAEVQFMLRAAHGRAGSTVRGWVRIFCGPVVIAETTLELTVVNAGAVVVLSPAAPQPVLRYRRIFPCYSHEDIELVGQVRAAVETLGDQYTTEVAAGDDGPEDWKLPLIAQADVFQLFWSTHSMASAACRRQWETAVATGRDGFIHPLYWEQPFPRADDLPPVELAELRFVRLPSELRAKATDTLWVDTPGPLQPPIVIGAITGARRDEVVVSAPSPVDASAETVEPSSTSRSSQRGLVSVALIVLASAASVVLGGSGAGNAVPGIDDGLPLGALVLLAAFGLGIALLLVAGVRWVRQRDRER